MKLLDCHKCGRWVEVDTEAKKVTCAYCVQLAIGFPEDIEKPKSSGRPAGWHFMNEFVDKDGTVFHKGVEQPDLKGTLKPTKVKPKKKAKRRSQEQILLDRHDEKKQALKKAIQKQKDFLNHNFGGQVFQRERESLDKQFKAISAKVLEAKHALDKLYYNDKLEEEYKDVFEDICTLLDILMNVRVDFEELRDKVMKNDV